MEGSPDSLLPGEFSMLSMRIYFWKNNLHLLTGFYDRRTIDRSIAGGMDLSGCY